MIRHVLIIATILWSTLSGSAYNLRQTYNIDGLPNSAILSMSLDDDGLLWVGTCDGVSIADGLDITPFPVLYPGLSLSGNLIEDILHAPNGVTWIQTNHGLDRFCRADGTVKSFGECKGDELICANDSGDLFLLLPKRGVFSYSDAKSAELTHIFNYPSKFEDVMAMAVRGDKLMFIDNGGVSLYQLKSKGTGRYDVDKGVRTLRRPLKFATAKRHVIWAVTDNNMLGTISAEGKFFPLIDITGVFVGREAISDIIVDRRGNIYIAFSTNGVVRIHKTDGSDADIKNIKPNVGVFSLECSDKQDVVWIGSDCHGIYTYSEGDYTLRTVKFTDLDRVIPHPVRSFYLDGDSTLWLGTKGSGILCVPKFNATEVAVSYPGKRLLTTANTGLYDNSVFAFAKSAGPRLWIATDGGVNYYDFRSKTIRRVPQHPWLRYIHGIYELDDNTLLVATLGFGLIKATIAGTPDSPILTNLQQYVTDDGEQASNYFFSITNIPGQGVILCNRGQGAFRFANDKLEKITYPDSLTGKSTYDVFSAVGDKSTLWLGTGNGLLRLSSGEEKLYSGLENGFVNNTVHDILTDGNGDLWISTNNGLVKFHPATEESLAFTRDSGLGVSEFSDGASLIAGNTMFFGGIDGFVVVTYSGTRVATAGRRPNFAPEIRLHSLNILGENANITKYVAKHGDEQRLRLSASQNRFSVTFCAPDYIDAANYIYYYSIDDSDGWINNGSNRTITFTELGYGSYKLMVKYVNRANGVESKPYVLNIKIDAPWYLSGLAKMIYLLLLVALIVTYVNYLMRRQKHRQADELKMMEYTHREEVYEEKLRFFTNITHEFSTPLTLIYGPCERILTYVGADDYIKRYVNLIRTNAERLNNLIQELIDFRRMETGHKVLKIHAIDISVLSRDTIEAYTELAETNHIDLQCRIKEDITWNSDFGSLRKVLNNLISNAFKYTPVGGRIEVEVTDTDHMLTISVYNTGKGIREEDKDRIFNRYSVLDNVEENAVKGLSSRNGLGLAICHSIVEMLKGTISIDSVVGEYAKFIVKLPPMEKLASTSEETVVASSDSLQPAVTVPAADSTAGSVVQTPKSSSANRPTIFVIDDNQEILSLLSDSLCDYNVVTATSGEEGLALLTKRQPDLIITDVMMPGIDGFELTRQIKSNIHTRYIPLIILSAKNSTKEKVDGLESGADVYIGKPFSLSYLTAVIKRLIEERNNLREYYNSSASAYEYNDGRLLGREARDLMDKVTAYIDSHIDDEKLSPDSLADHLQISLRNLYRKFKDLELPAPNDFIKNQRMAVAAKMLVTTSDTVQEIMYRIGFTNRSHFYKEFGRRYGMTPGDYRAHNRHIDTSLSDNNNN